MAWVQLSVTGLLALLVLLVGFLALGLRRRVTELEGQLAARSPSSDAYGMPESAHNLPFASLDDPPAAEYVITRIGELEPEEEPVEVVPTVEPKMFADIVLRESVVQAASFAHGLRRALAPETRNRIRFHMRQEVKRSRKQRRAELRAVRREWAARQRATMAAEERAPEGSAA